MATGRFNIFYLIHKALRAIASDALNTIQQTDFNKSEELELAVLKTSKVISMYEGHAGHEDHFIIPALEKYAKEVTDEFEKEHVTDRQLGDDLNATLAALKSSVSDEQRKELGLRLMYQVSEFVSFNLHHMNKEEDILNNLLWKHYSDSEIIAIQARLLEAVGQEERILTAEWMIRSASNDELRMFFAFQKGVLPPPVFEMLTKMAENILPPARWNFVKEA